MSPSPDGSLTVGEQLQDMRQTLHNLQTSVTALQILAARFDPQTAGREWDEMRTDVAALKGAADWRKWFVPMAIGLLLEAGGVTVALIGVLHH